VENDISIWEVGKPIVGLINGILILLRIQEKILLKCHKSVN
jgi:hypothetical protein